MTRRAIRGASCLLLTLAVPAVAAELTVDTGGPRIFTTAELLARPDAATITVPDDATFRREMTYRAVPLRALIEGAPPAGKDVSVIAADGFVTNLPAALVRPPDAGEAAPWPAIEPPHAPWPEADGKAPGPVYLLMRDPAPSAIPR